MMLATNPTGASLAVLSARHGNTILPAPRLFHRPLRSPAPIRDFSIHEAGADYFASSTLAFSAPFLIASIACSQSRLSL